MIPLQSWHQMFRGGCSHQQQGQFYPAPSHTLCIPAHYCFLSVFPQSIAFGKMWHFWHVNSSKNSPKTVGVGGDWWLMRRWLGKLEGVLSFFISVNPGLNIVVRVGVRSCRGWVWKKTCTSESAEWRFSEISLMFQRFATRGSNKHCVLVNKT